MAPTNDLRLCQCPLIPFPMAVPYVHASYLTPYNIIMCMTLCVCIYVRAMWRINLNGTTVEKLRSYADKKKINVKTCLTITATLELSLCMMYTN